MSALAIVTLAAAAAVALLLAITPAVDAHRRAALRRLLPGVCRIFEAHHIDYWCDFGTLLGFHRDGDIIRGDKDIDVSIMESEKPRVLALRDVLRAHGYDISDQGGRTRKLIRIYDRRTRYYMDVYPYVRDGALLRSVLASPHEDIPERLVARRVPAQFLGTTIRVPADVIGVLRYRYGPEYATPRRGDKGIARPYSFLRSVFEDLQDNVLGIRAWLR